MKILLISHTCQSATEGQPKARCLARIPGVELHVLSPDRWLHYGVWRAAAVPPADCGFRYRAGRVRWPWIGPAQFYLHWYPELGRMLREFRPDVIDLWEEPWSLVSAQACWLRCRLLPRAKLISETEQNINKRLPPPFEWLRRYTLRNADFAIGRNAEAIEVLRQKGYAGPAGVVPNAVDAELFRPMDRCACRAALGLSGFVVGYVGRLVPEKGLADAIAAMARCPVAVNLLFVGSGPFEAELRRLADELGVASRVRWLPACKLADLPPVMNAMDVLVLPSRTTPRWKEQFGRVVIEANACGTPVIGSDSGAIPEVVGSAGLIVPERDPAALALAIERMADDPAWRKELGCVGRAEVEAKFTWQRVAQQMYAVYEQCLRGSRPVPG